MTPSRAVRAMTFSEAPGAMIPLKVARAMTSSKAVPAMTPSQAVRVMTSSQARRALTRSFRTSANRVPIRSRTSTLGRTRLISLD